MTRRAGPALACPHCRAAGLAWLAKLRSDRDRPARCAACGGLAHQSAALALARRATAFPLLVAAVLLAERSRSAWPPLAALGVWAALAAASLAWPATALARPGPSAVAGFLPKTLALLLTIVVLAWYAR